MKKNLQKIAYTIFGLVLLSNVTISQTKLIHYWHFNNTLPTTGAGGIHFGTSPINADFTRYNSKAYVRYTKVPNCIKDTGYIDNNVGDSTNQRIGYGACCPAYGSTTNNSSVRLRNPSDSMMFLMYIPTKNFKNIVVKYGSQASSTASGPHRQNYDYSLDSGATYITTGLPKLFDSTGIAWGKMTLNLSAISTLSNTSKLILRMKLAAPNTGSSGNIRVDNITVEGDSIVAGSTVGLNQVIAEKSNYHIFPNPSKDLILISCPPSNSRSITIFNLTGEQVYLKQKEDGLPINISNLNNGIYFIQLKENSTNELVTLKFIKE